MPPLARKASAMAFEKICTRTAEDRRSEWLVRPGGGQPRLFRALRHSGITDSGGYLIPAMIPAPLGSSTSSRLIAVSPAASIMPRNSPCEYALPSGVPTSILSEKRAG